MWSWILASPFWVLLVACALVLAVHDTLWVTASMYNQYGMFMFGLAVGVFFLIEGFGNLENIAASLDFMIHFMRTLLSDGWHLRWRGFWPWLYGAVGIGLAYVYQWYLFRTSFVQINRMFTLHHYSIVHLTPAQLVVMIQLACLLTALLFWSQWMEWVAWWMAKEGATWRQDILWWLGRDYQAKQSRFSMVRGLWRCLILGVGMTFGTLLAFIATSTLITGFLKYQVIMGTVYHLPHHGPDLLVFIAMLFISLRMTLKLARMICLGTERVLDRGLRQSVREGCGNLVELSWWGRLLAGGLTVAAAIRCVARVALARQLATDPFGIDRVPLSVAGSLARDMTSAWYENYASKPMTTPRDPKSPVVAKTLTFEQAIVPDGDDSQSSHDLPPSPRALGGPG